MRFQGVVEISPDVEGRLSSPLLAAAYHASRSGVVLLVLDGTTPHSVDRALDPIVARLGTQADGLLYMTGAAPATIARAATGASFVVASTPAFGAAMTAAGVTVQGPDEWLNGPIARRQTMVQTSFDPRIR